jgi:hypothetical protein
MNSHPADARACDFSRRIAFEADNAKQAFGFTGAKLQMGKLAGKLFNPASEITAADSDCRGLHDLATLDDGAIGHSFSQINHKDRAARADVDSCAHCGGYRFRD